MINFVQKIIDNNTAMKTLTEERRELVHSYFKHGLVALIALHPIVNRVRWVQYAPSFNDGDPCIFSKHDNEIDYEIDGIIYRDADDVEEEDNIKPVDDLIKRYDDKYNLRWLNHDAEKAFNQINYFINLLSDDDFEDLFGDGVEVIATKDGITVEDHYHD